MENRRPVGFLATRDSNNSNNNNNKDWDFDNDDDGENYSSTPLTSSSRNGSKAASSMAIAPLKVAKKDKRIDFRALASRRGSHVHGDRHKISPMATRPSNISDREQMMSPATALVIDTQRLQLISPPPEETLSRHRSARLSGQFTPSLLGGSSPAPGPSTIPSATTTTTATKRKRTQQPQPHHASGKDAQDSSGMDPTTYSTSTDIQHPVEATPNPKPRKLGRHARSMQQVDSPTKGSRPQRSNPNNDDLQEQADHAMDEGSDASPQSVASPPRRGAATTPRRGKDQNTTPSRPKRVLVQSPYAKNPDADWIEPVPALALTAQGPVRRAVLSSRSSRRSETPIPHYEPPTDIFTPPKVVYMTPVPRTATRKNNRTPTTKAKAERKPRASTLRVMTSPLKQEIPDDIDLSAPMPPPSPSDDPLLLSGPIEAPQSSPLRRMERAPSLPRVWEREERFVQADMMQENELVQEQDDDDDDDDDILPPSSPEQPLDSEDAQAARTFDWDRHAALGSTETEEDSMMRIDPRDADVTPVRLFDLGDLPSADSGGWSDSDDEETGPPVTNNGISADDGEVGEGRYTGRWQMMRVRTKQDPPSSATRHRMDAWGHPISPFPTKLKMKKLDLLGEEEEEVRRMSVEPEESEDLSLEDQSPNQHFEDPLAEESSNAPSTSQSRPHSVADESIEAVQDDDISLGQSSPDGAFEQPLAEQSFEESLEEPSFEEQPSFEDASLGQSFEEPLADRSFEEPVTDRSFTESVEEQDEEEEQEVRQMSVEYSDEEPEETAEEPAAAQLEARQPSPAPTVQIDHRFDFSASLRPKPSRPPSPHPGLVDEDSHMQDVADADQDVVHEDDDDDEASSDGDYDPGLVKITSADPRAAARAAAILKQHDYDCYTKVVLKQRHSEAKQRRASHSGADELAKESRRRDLASSAISKSSYTRRKSTLGMGVIGDRVFIPGTPVMTLPQLLQEAEAEVQHDHEQVLQSPGRVWSARAKFEGDPYKTPLPDRRISALRSESRPLSAFQHSIGARAWSKDDWRQLDACFTDQRLDLGATLPDATEDTLAPVDMVSIDDVIDRFIGLVGGQELVEKYGDAWTRESLLERARALQRKQLSGHVAAPTTPRSPPFSFTLSSASPTTQNVLDGQRRPHIEVPDFTPLSRRALPHPRKASLSKAVLPAPVVQDAPFANLPADKERPARRISSTLLAPRYSHLLEEAIKISLEGEHRAVLPQPQDLEQPEGDESFGSTFTDSQVGEVQEMEEHDDELEDATTTPHPRRTNTTNEPPNTTIGTRVKGFLFSYLRPSKAPSSVPAPRRPVQPRKPGLPLPPPAILEKPRGPVTTPARLPITKPKHPKELVQLHHAPAPSTSAIPRRVAKPAGRLVELHHAPPPIEQPVVKLGAPRPRRSSGSSVKDLVRGFEAMDKESKEDGLRRMRSVGELKKQWRAGAGGDTRPKWKF